MPSPCVYCHPAREDVVWSDAHCRALLVQDADFPGLCRVVLNTHVKEFSDLARPLREHVMQVVYAVETAQRELLRPDKVNLASFGNMVPHLHWHVIPRYHDDSHFPEPTWGSRQRPTPARPLPEGFRDALAARLAALVAQ